MNFSNMKTRTSLLAVAALILMAVIPTGAKAQDPFKNLKENYLVTTVQTPNIVGFVSAFLSEPEDEHTGALADVWDKYLKNEPQDKGVTLTVDKKNGYVRYELDYDVAYPDDKMGIMGVTEFCYWNCDDGKHKLFAENVSTTQDGKPFFGQFDGLYIYVYDNATKKLYMIGQDLLGLDDEIRGENLFRLPQKGKDIDVFFSDGTQKKLTWNGKGFTLK